MVLSKLAAVILRKKFKVYLSLIMKITISSNLEIIFLFNI